MANGYRPPGNYNCIRHDPWGYPSRFRAPKNITRAPVKGGRWEVRKYRDSPSRPWRAWSNGRASAFGGRFETQAEAFAWANWVALQFKTRDTETAVTICKVARRQKHMFARALVEEMNRHRELHH